MKPRKPLIAFVTSIIVCCPGVRAAEIVKLQNTNQLDNVGSWSGGVLPGSSDVMLWNSTYTTPGATATLSALGTSLSVAGIKVTNVGGTRNLGTTMVGFNNSATNPTLTIGASGIDLSAATQAFYAASKITLGSNQEWKISDANTNSAPTGLNNNEDLAFVAQVAAAAFDLGGKVLTTSGAGQATITSGYTLSNGTLNVGNNLFVIQGGSSKATTINNTVSLNVAAGSTLRLQSNSGPLNSSAPISVNGTLVLNNNGAANLVTQSGAITMAAGSTISSSPGTANSNYTTISGSLTINGDINWNHTGTVASPTDVSGNISGAGNINYQDTNTNAAAFTRWSGNNSGYTGTVSINGTAGTRALRLNTSTAGSAAATWNVSAGTTLQINGVSPQIGTLNGAGTVTNTHASSAATINVGSGSFSGVISNGTPVMNLTKTGSGTLTLSGANTYTGATTVNGGTLRVSGNTTGASSVTVADGATFEVNVPVQSDQITLTSLTTGTTTGCTVGINNGTFNNPEYAPIIAPTFTVNAPTVLSLTGVGLSAGTIPLISYTTLGGTSGFAGLSLKLPPRVNGSLVNNPNSVDVNITSVEGIRWKGNVNQDWDADTVGDGSVGTPNWETTVTTASTRYLQGAGGTDGVLFNDLASGSGSVTVNLTTTLTPTAVTVNNETRNYLLAGPGSISGTATLFKTGAGNLTLANTTANTYSGLTTIDLGSITLGDGTTVGAGTIGGNIENYGELILNRPDNFTFSNTLTGTGKLTKNQANIVTFSTTTTVSGDVAINGGTLVFGNGGTLSGVVLGSGNLECSAGTLILSGAAANTRTGNTVVSGTGILKLQKDPGVFPDPGPLAVSGDVYCTGSTAGALQVLSNEQIADTADLYILGTSGDPMAGSTGSETVRNVLVNTSNGTGGQLVLKNNFTATGTVTLTSGIMGAGSGSTCTLGGIVVTSPINTIIRVAGNSAAATMNIGAGGVTAAGGDWQVKFNTANNDAIVNLGGDVTTTGNFTISNGAYTGANLNVINLTGSRTFTIAAGTTTTVAPDFSGDPLLTADTGDSFTGSLTKAGDGKLVLNASCNLGHTGTTTVSAGTLILNGTAPNSAPAVASGATLGGSGTITASTTFPSGAIVSPGDGTVATLTFGNDITLDAGSIYAVGITGAATCDKLATATGTLTANGTIAVTLSGYTPVANDSFDIADAATITGTPTFDFSAATLPVGLAWDTTNFATTGAISVKQLGYESFVSIITNPDDRDPSDDPDGDGINNLLEYALGGNPTVAGQSILPQGSIVGSDLVLTFSRRDDSENDTTQVVQIGTDLSDWSTVVPITPSGTLPPGVTVSVQENGAADDSITVTIEKGAQTRKFAKLRVTK